MVQYVDSTSTRAPLCLHIIGADLKSSVNSRAKLSAAVTLPSKQILRTHPLPSQRSPEWNRQYNFTTTSSSSITIQLIVERSLMGRMVHGEIRITIKELLQRCSEGQDCKLELRTPSFGRVRGQVTVRLERISRDAPSQSQGLMSNDLARIEQELQAQYIAQVGGIDDEDPMGVLCSLLERMKPFTRVLDTASKLHPTLENTWGSVSSIYKEYQKKKIVDEDIKILVRAMRNSLKFCQDPSIERILSQSEETIEKLLQTIHKSIQQISEYLNATAIGRVWKTGANIQILREYRTQIESLSHELHGDAIISVASALRITKSEGTHLVVPPPPTGLFAGREDHLTQMEDSLNSTRVSMGSAKQWIFVLYGIGGSGKTQITLKFVERNSAKFTKMFIIDASTEESIERSFSSIGTAMDIENASTSHVLARLSQIKEDWLLIFDNADNLELRLLTFIPKASHGNIIITTRNAGLKSLVSTESLEVLRLDEATAVHLLLQSGQLPHTEENRRFAQTLVNKFGCLALAVVQAGSYIASRGIDLLAYSQMYDDSPSKLLQIEPGNNVDYRSSVFATWEITYTRLGCHAQTLLNIFSFLHRDGITSEIIKMAITSESAVQDVAQGNQLKATPSHSFSDLIHWLRNEAGQWNIHHFMELMHNLCSYSLIQQPFPGIYSIHPLVHEWARNRLATPMKEIMQQDTWLLLYYAVPSPKSNAYNTISRAILPHLRACGHPELEDMKIMEVFADIYSIGSRWNDMKPLQECIVKQQVQENGHEHTRTLQSMQNLASTYKNLGQWSEAEKLQVEVLEARKKLLGPTHLDTLLVMTELASTYSDQGRWSEAEKLNIEVLEARNRLLGPDNPHTHTSMTGLASIYQHQGRWSEAAELQVKVLEGKKQQLGPTHHSTFISMGNLALTYSYQDLLDEAEKLNVEVMEGLKQLLGPDHPDTLTAMGNLVAIYGKQGRWSDAEKLEREVLEATKQLLGSDHPDTLRSMGKLASTYWEQGWAAEAKELEVEVLDAKKRLLGPDHPDTLTAMNNLACTFMNLGQFDEAEDLLDSCVESSVRILGPCHYRTRIFRQALVTLYRMRGWTEKADELEANLPN